MEIPIAGAILWLIGVNIAATLTAMWDKNRARRREFRVPESTLWMLAAVGGAAAMWVTMYVIRHKTRHLKFTIGVPAILIFQILIFLWIF